MSNILNIGHAAFNMKHTDAMLKFYTDILGMKEQYTLTFGGLADSILARSDNLPEEHRKQVQQMKDTMGDQKWITYLTFADHQYIEFFYEFRPLTDYDNRSGCYGYNKLNFEVADIRAWSDYLKSRGVSLLTDVHPTLDGSEEISFLDPDGNEVQLTQYGPDAGKNLGITPVGCGDGSGKTKVSAKPCGSENRDAAANTDSCASAPTVPPLFFTTQVAYQVQNDQEMLDFYTKGLGLKRVFYLTYGMMAEALKASGIISEEQAEPLLAQKDKVWIDYIEVAPHQYIELFHGFGQTLEERRDLTGYYGYQHLCIEVADIQKALDDVTANGLTPDTPLNLGADYSYQFWLVDPDGNRLEMMQYTEKSLQLTPIS